MVYFSDELDPSQVLIPLDGTHEAEAVLVFCSSLMKAGATTFHLLAVLEPLDDDEKRDGELRQAHDQGRTNLETYLEAKANDPRKAGRGSATAPSDRGASGRNAGGRRRPGSVPHGPGDSRPDGTEPMGLGSVADKVLRAPTRRTLLIGPNIMLFRDTPRVERITVPLNGSKLAEQAIAPAVSLARSLGAPLELVTVPTYHVPFGTDPYLSLNFRSIIGRLEARAGQYLESVRLPEVDDVARVTLTHAASGDVGAVLNRHFSGLAEVLWS